MAIDPSVEYPGQIDTTDPDMPNGKAQNESALSAGDGTPLEKGWVNDFLGFVQATLAFDNASPSGNSEKVGASQLLDAFIRRFGQSARLEQMARTAREVAFNGTGFTVTSSGSYYYIEELKRWYYISGDIGSPFDVGIWSSTDGENWGAATVIAAASWRAFGSNPVWDGANGFRIILKDKEMWASSDGLPSSLVLHSTLPATARAWTTGQGMNFSLARDPATGRFAAMGYNDAFGSFAPGTRVFYLPSVGTTWTEATWGGATYNDFDVGQSIVSNNASQLGVILRNTGGTSYRYCISNDGGASFTQVATNVSVGQDFRYLAFMKPAGVYLTRVDTSGPSSTGEAFISDDMATWTSIGQNATGTMGMGDSDFDFCWGDGLIASDAREFISRVNDLPCLGASGVTLPFEFQSTGGNKGITWGGGKVLIPIASNGRYILMEYT